MKESAAAYLAKARQALDKARRCMPSAFTAKPGGMPNQRGSGGAAVAINSPLPGPQTSTLRLEPGSDAHPM